MKEKSLKKVELLAPAGGYEAFISAINAGADAVYMGLKNFNARVMTNNFTVEEYIEAIDYAHKRDVNVYLTLNTLLLDSEIKQALEMVYKLYEAGLDGVIVQDVGIATLIHKLMPDLSLHASTQMSICTLEQVENLEKLGFKRVVLARELSIDEIRYIAANTSLEIEVFVHGALCVAVSGQCLMSAMIGNRSANRGSCAGPCRKKYSLYNGSGKLIQKNKYLLSKKDIFGLDKLQELIDAGVDSLKIEGRNKTEEYVAGVVRSYKEALDKKNIENVEREVLQLFNRSGKSYGYLEGVRYRESISEYSPKNTGVVLGQVCDVKKEYIKIELKEEIDLHDGVESLGENVSSTIVTCIRDKDFNVINCKVEKGNIVWLGDVHGMKKGDIIYKTSSNELNQKLSKYANANMRKVEYNVLVTIKENQEISAKAGEVEVTIPYIPQESRTSSISENRIKETFAKTEETSVKFNIACDVQQGLFVPASKLNELRKELVNKIEQSKIIRKQIKNVEDRINNVLELKQDKTKMDKVNSLYVYKYNKNLDYLKWYSNKYGKILDVLYVNAADFIDNREAILENTSRCKVYFVIPNVTLKNTTKYIIGNLEDLCKRGISGILLGNIGYIDFCLTLKNKYNIELVADYCLNITNRYSAAKYKELGIDRVTPLFESDEVDIYKINEVAPIEIVQDMATVMTTRYCVIASFVKDIKAKGECEAECRKNNYYLMDELNKRYDILTEPLDCITKYVRNKRQYPIQIEEKFSTRHCIL